MALQTQKGRAVPYFVQEFGRILNLKESITGLFFMLDILYAIEYARDSEL